MIYCLKMVLVCLSFLHKFLDFIEAPRDQPERGLSLFSVSIEPTSSLFNQVLISLFLLIQYSIDPLIRVPILSQHLPHVEDVTFVLVDHFSLKTPLIDVFGVLF